MGDKPLSKNKKHNRGQYIPLILYMLIGVACGFCMIRYIDGLFIEGKPIYESILMIAVLFIGMYVSIFFSLLIHEIGHLVFGLFSGYKFSSFHIFGIMLVKENGKLKLCKLTIAGTGGQCLMSPPDMKDGKIPVALYNLGGSLMNIIFGILFLFLFFAFKNIVLLSDILLMASIIEFAIAFMNGIPMKMGIVDNDGYNAFSLTKNNEALHSFWIQMKVNENISNGIRLKDMPDEWFSIPSDDAMENSMTAVLGVLACNRLMDSGKFEEADKLMAHLLEIDSGIIGLHRSLMICDRMYIEMITENRHDIIDNMLTKEQKRLQKQMQNFPSVLRTEYTYALLYEKDKAKAEKIKTQFEKNAESYPYPNEIVSERELIMLADTKI